MFPKALCAVLACFFSGNLYTWNIAICLTFSNICLQMFAFWNEEIVGQLSILWWLLHWGCCSFCFLSQITAEFCGNLCDITGCVTSWKESTTNGIYLSCKALYTSSSPVSRNKLPRCLILEVWVFFPFAGDSCQIHTLYYDLQPVWELSGRIYGCYMRSPSE